MRCPTRRRAGDGLLELDAGFHDLPVEFVLPHAILNQPALLMVSGRQGGAPLVRLSGDEQGCGFGRVEGVFLGRLGGDERRRGRARQPLQPAVEYRQPELLDQLAPTNGDAVLRRVCGLQPLQLDLQRRSWLDHKPGLGAAPGHHAQFGLGSRRSAISPVAEGRPDPGLHGGDVEVAHRHQHRPLRTVVMTIEAGDQGVVGPLDLLDLADGQPPGRQLTLQREGQLLFDDPQSGGVTGPFLGQDHTAFPADGAVADEQLAGPLAQQHEAGVDGVLVSPRQVELIDRFGPRGLGVGVGSERQAMALEYLDHLVFGHPPGALEIHVLQEVRDALLGVGFHQRSGVIAHAQGGLAGGGGVAHDGVAHAVAEHAEADVGIGGDVGSGLRPTRKPRFDERTCCPGPTQGDGQAGQKDGETRSGGHEIRWKG